MDAKSIHIQEETAREDGHFLEALKLSDEAMLLYQQEGDMVGFSEIQSSRFEIFKQLYLQTDDKNYLILAKMAAKTGVIIARKSEQPEALSIPLFCLAKAYALKEKYDKAVEFYKEALTSLPQSQQNRPSVLADIKVHLEIAAFMNGDAEAIVRADEALQELKKADENTYEKDVWVSGGYMKIAEALYPTDTAKAKEYLSTAQNIIDANPDLILRKQQLERLIQKLEGV